MIILNQPTMLNIMRVTYEEHGVFVQSQKRILPYNINLLNLFYTS